MNSLIHFFQKTKQFFIRIWNFIVRIFTKLQKWLIKNGPSVDTQKGAVIALFIGVLAYLGYRAGITFRSGEGLIVDIAIGIGIGIICLLLTTLGIRLALKILKKIPIKYGSLFIGGMITFFLFFNFSFKEIWPFFIWVYLAFAIFGGVIYHLIKGQFLKSGALNKIFVVTAFLASVASFVLFIIWLGGTGTEKGLVKIDKYEYAPMEIGGVEDPSLNGTYTVKTTSYGSGKDRRDIFGKDAEIITEPVNAKPFVNKLSGRFNKIRKRFWGFNRTKFPVNGRVWYPEGEGKFPLVLIVHGNHSMREYSDPGYAYLGEFLASRGFIVVSVDENFLNGDWTQNYRTESDGRGWMMLQHLSVWREWQKILKILSMAKSIWTIFH